jgi:DMSO/TMAO reductase YedYZ heme-binding membrane subunit
VGYSFLIAMVLTSFKFGRSRLNQKQWKILHTGGIYWLWFYAWSVYWFSLFYYQSAPVLLDYIYYWGGFLAWGLRLCAWSKKRWRQTAVPSPA